MRFAKERIQKISAELRHLAVVKKEKISGWQIKEGCYIDIAEADASEAEWKPFDSEKERWYGPDKHYWFRTEITIPEDMDGKPVWLVVHTALQDWDDGRNPQFLVFVNGEVTQGLDINHREIYLTAMAKAGDTYKIDMQSYTGTIHHEFRLVAELQVIDPQIQALHYDIQIPLWSFNRLKENDRPRLEYEEILTETINLLDLRKPYSEEFYASLKVASDYIAKHIYEDMTGYDDIIASCVGHTHIDVAWLWTVDQVRQKSCRSFATVLKLMDEYPDYHFMSSQPQLYKFVKERHPEEYARIKQRVAEGRWEPEGGMWVEADCNLTSGESLVRQFLVGKKFFKEEFGKDNRILWLPDVFGYSAALPQIMKKSGIDYFMTTKLAWNQYNKIPCDTFKWEGIDGSEVFSHMITTLGVGQPTTDFFTTYNGTLHPDSIMGGWERYQNKDINNDILISYGFGDGGGGPTRQMLETSMRMQKGLKGIPKVRQVGSRTYFEELEARVADSKRLPKWVGELYFEYHRGTLTSMGRNKRSNRKSEFGMMELELLATMALGEGVAYPKQEMDDMWELILRNQFHDILPGSSITEVYNVTKKEYEEIKEKIGKLIAERLAAVLKEGSKLTVFNTLGFERNDVVNLGDVDVAAVTDGTNVYPAQKTAEGTLAYVKNMPSKGYITLTEAEGEVATPFTITDGAIETPFYSIKLNEACEFTSIYDKEAKREVLLPGQCGNALVIYEDKPMNYSCWDIDAYYQEKSFPVQDVTKMEWTECGPVRATLELERHCMDTVIRQKIHFYADTRRIDFDTYVDWKFSENIMKVHFPVDVHTDEATFDIQFGNVKRKIHQNTSWDQARFESCAHKWVDVSESGYGVSLMNDCKYGHSIINHSMALTLIKSGIEPNPVTDQEEHYMTYSLYPHMGNWQDGNTVQESFNINVPAKVEMAAPAADRFSFVSQNCRNVVLETVKRAEDGDGVIVRLYEVENRRSEVTVQTALDIKEVVETNLMEDAVENGAVQAEGNTFTFTIKPYEIKTFRIR